MSHAFLFFPHEGFVDRSILFYMFFKTFIKIMLYLFDWTNAVFFGFHILVLRDVVFANVKLANAGLQLVCFCCWESS